MTPYIRLAELGLTLPEPPTPIANFVTLAESGRLIFLSGQGPLRADGTLLHRQGRRGRHASSEAYGHARLTGLNLLAVMHAAARRPRPHRARRQAARLRQRRPRPSATIPKVVNGCSDLFADVFGSIGGHARSAIGVGSLPDNITVEIEAIVEIAA